MATLIDLYRTDDFVKVGSVGLTELLSPVFQLLLGRSLTGAEFDLTFLPISDTTVLDGTPTLVNLHGSHGYVQVRITQGAVVLYQHPHSVREIVGKPLQALLGRRFPGEKHMGFGIAGNGLGSLALVRPTPENENTIEIRPQERRAPVFYLEEIHDPVPPLATAADLGVAVDGWTGALGVVLSSEVHSQLLHALPFSADVEEGGFLAGQVYRDAARPERHLVLVSAVLRAERTGASLLHFTFTGDSFLLVNELLVRRGRNERLVGWYHTHLFPATDALGLSTIDVELHRSTFRREWQVAGLVNVDGSRRQLRFYGTDGDRIALLPYRVGTG
jgi:proteasome lid subunit RPN8/RPN11